MVYTIAYFKGLWEYSLVLGNTVKSIVSEESEGKGWNQKEAKTVPEGPH